MSLIGARRSPAACASLFALAVSVSMHAGDCPASALNPQAAQRRLDELGKNAQVEMAQQRF